MVKPSSVEELSVHAKLIWLLETAVAVSPEGAASVAWVVALATFEKVELAEALYAWTLNWY
jgi:hypothetical protein